MWVSVAVSCGLLVLGLFRYAASFCMNIGIFLTNEFQFEKKKGGASNPRPMEVVDATYSNKLIKLICPL